LWAENIFHFKIILNLFLRQQQFLLTTLGSYTSIITGHRVHCLDQLYYSELKLENIKIGDRGECVKKIQEVVGT
jgi:hypothetical protein